MMKSPLPGWEKVLNHVRIDLGPERKPLLIAVDGVDNVGKSSFASWLAWQIAMPAVHLDLHVIKGSRPLQWRGQELARIVGSRIDNGNPVVVEGILVLYALDQILRRPDFLIYISGESTSSISRLLDEYRVRQNPEKVARTVLEGFKEVDF